MKKLFALFCIMLLVLGTVSFSAAEEDTPHMELVNVPFDLQFDVPATIYVQYAGLDGYYPNEVTVSEVSRKESRGKTTLVLKYVSTADFHLTDDEIRSMIVNTPAFYITYCVVDYNTGKSLEKKNSFGVSVKNKMLKKENETTVLKTAENEEKKVYTKIVEEITITYPQDYHGLCFGALGWRQIQPASELFWNGTYPFKTTIYYDNTKVISHFMRINEETEPDQSEENPG